VVEVPEELTTMHVQVVEVLDMFTLIHPKVFRGQLPLQLALGVQEELVYH
jgi:hypothetical protein